MKKRVLSLLLIMILTLSVSFAATVSAAGENMQISVGNVTIEAGATTVKVPVTVSNNVGFSTAEFKFTYNKNVLTLTNNFEYGIIINGEIVDKTSADMLMINSSTTDRSASDGYNITGDGTLFTIEFNVAANAAAGEYTISISETDDMPITDGKTCEFLEDLGIDYNLNAGSVKIQSPAPTTYTVTYNANGGTTGATPATVEANGAADLTKEASKDGYTFLGWNTDKDAKTKLDSYTVTGNVTLYAIYEENPVPTGPVLNGIATRRASSVTIDNANHIVNIVYDTAQNVYVSSYVGFAPIVADGVEVTYSGADFREKVARLANYTVTTGSAANIDLLAEKTDKTKEAIDGYIYYVAGNAGLHNFAMILTEGDVSTEYAVNITLADLATEGNVITEEMANTEGFYKAGRTSDIVDIDTGKKIITLTTKNIYNYTTFGLNAVALTGIETANVRPRRTIEVVNEDNNIKYTVFSNSNLYDRGVLISYNEGETKEYTLKIYGGKNGMSYETYTLIVNYVPNVDTSTITIHRVQAVENARANKAAEINENSAISVTYDEAYDNEGFAIKFVPILRRGLTGEFIGGKGDTATFPVCGAERPMYVIDDINDVDSFTYRVKYFRDYRDFDVNFIPKA